MQATALICNEQQQFSLETVNLPEAGAGDLVIRTLYSGVSIGTEFALIRNKISWGPYPLCTGYQGVGVVESAGSAVSGFPVGALVYCRDAKGGTLANGQAYSSVCGTHCSHMVVDPATSHGIAVLPEGVPLEAASLFVMPAVGLAGVSMANPRLGSTVVVYGAGPIGLGVVAACSHRGCRVIAMDVKEQPLAMARKLGADEVVLLDGGDPTALIPDGADTVFECTGIPACILQAIPLCKPFGSFVMQGNYGARPIELNFLDAHNRTLTMYFPMDDGYAPCRRAVLKNMAMGVLPWADTITHRLTADESPAFYAGVNSGAVKDVVSAVVRWSTL